MKLHHRATLRLQGLSEGTLRGDPSNFLSDRVNKRLCLVTEERVDHKGGAENWSQEVAGVAIMSPKRPRTLRFVEDILECESLLSLSAVLTIQQQFKAAAYRHTPKEVHKARLRSRNRRAYCSDDLAGQAYGGKTELTTPTSPMNMKNARARIAWHAPLGRWPGLFRLEAS